MRKILFVLFIFSLELFSVPCFSPYELNREYYTGSKVSYLGKNYESNWSTREIPGVNNWGGWKEIESCEEETIIDLSDSENQEKNAVGSVSQFLLFATNELNLNSGVKISGNIGANDKVLVGMSAGWQTIVNGDIYSKGNVSTSAEATINGDVYANGGLTLGWEAKHNGEIYKNHEYDFNIERKTVSASSQDVKGKWREKVILNAGNYKDVSVRDGGSLELAKGIYNLKALSLNSNDLEINLNILAGENIQLNIQDSIHLGSGTKITFSGKKSPLSLKIYTNQTSDLIIPDSSEINAIITAPNAKVVVNSGAKVNGAIFAKEIEVKYAAIVNGVPYITDIFHSQYHFAPEFDVKTAEYFSVIGLNENIEFAEVAAPKNYKITQTNTGDKYLFEIEDTISGIVSYYTLKFQRFWTNAVFVNSNSSGGSGESWSSALNNLQNAIRKAKETGKEIRVAEGIYENIKISQGTKILGGYLGTEADEKPLGSPYKTIITGRNIAQSVVINGFEYAKSVKIKGLTIQDGKSATNGGGVFSEKVIPKIEECIIQNNTAKENGAGIYASKGVQDLQMVLFERNIGKSAFYLESKDKDNIKAERVVFSGNSGAALAAKNANIEFVNSIFYGNDTAILAEKSGVSLIHCTSTKNNVGVVSKNSVVKAVNSIFWNEGSEFSGGGFEFEFSCVKGGGSGEGNISEEPLFKNINRPKGNDGIWGTEDDELRLKNNSPCVNKGNNSNILEDITFRNRPMHNEFDIGAYETIIINENEELGLGFLTIDNEFKQEWSPIIQHGLSVDELRKYKYSKGAVTIRIKVEKNKYTKDISAGDGYVRFKDENGKNLPELKIRFYRNGETGSHYLFTSQVAKDGDYVKGKPILLVLEPELASQNDSDFYLLPASLDGSIKIRIPYKQFK